MRELSRRHSRAHLIALLAFVAALAAGLALLSSGCSSQDAGDEASVQTAQAGAEQETVQTAEPEVVESEDAPLTAEVEVVEIENMPEPEPEMPVVMTSELWNSGNRDEYGNFFYYFEEDTLYMDDYFGYSIVIPAGYSCFGIYGDPGGCSATFSDGNGGNINIDIGGTNSDWTLEEEYNDYVDVFNPSFAEILEDESAFVISGTEDHGDYYYMIEYVGGPGGSTNSLRISYYPDYENEDTVFNTIVPSFKPGDIWSSHTVGLH